MEAGEVRQVTHGNVAPGWTDMLNLVVDETLATAQSSGSPG